MGYFALIGGKSIDKSDDFSLELKILEELGLEKSKLLFIPLASPNFKQSKDRFLKMTKGFKGSIAILDEIDEHVNKKIAESDVIYFGGGSATNLVKLVKDNMLDKILKQLVSTNKLLMGLSAGAILYSSYGMGDQNVYKDYEHLYNYQMVRGLGLLDIVICPHYDHDGLWCFNEEVKKYNLEAYALEDDTAILIGNKKVKVFKTNSSKSVYYFDNKNNYLMIPLYEVRK